MLSIEMLQAAHGDCLWIEYGDPPDVRRVLIDGGPWFTYANLVDRIRQVPVGQRTFELLVITHIDTDHIDGAIRLLREKHLAFKFGEVWFNGWPQITPDALAPKHGEYLGAVIEAFEDASGAKVWNKHFDRKAVRADVAASTAPLDGGLTVTVLGPSLPRLVELRQKWVQEMMDLQVETGDSDTMLARLAGEDRLVPMLTEPEAPVLVEEPPAELPAVATLGRSDEPGSDDSAANGSSIALHVRHGDRTALLLGDAFAADVETACRAMAGGEDRLRVDAVKLGHHGSVRNVTAEMLRAISSKHYLISTNGKLRAKHPDEEAIDLVLAEHDTTRGKPQLHFNYLSDTTTPWSTPSDDYDAHFEQGALLLG